MNELTPVSMTGNAAQTAVLITTLAEVVLRTDCDPAKIKAIYDVKRNVERDMAQDEFNIAMSDLQGELLPVFRDAPNPQTHSKYARLESIQLMLQPLMMRHRFSVSYNVKTSGKLVSVSAVVARGAYEREYGPIEAECDTSGAKGNVNKTELHGFGSTRSYLQRYLLTGIFNVPLAHEDDDGNGGKTVVRGNNGRADTTAPNGNGATNGATNDTKQPETWLAKTVRDLIAAKDGFPWGKALVAALKTAPSKDEVLELGEMPAVQKNINNAPADMKRKMEAAFADAIERHNRAAETANTGKDAAGDDDHAEWQPPASKAATKPAETKAEKPLPDTRTADETWVDQTIATLELIDTRTAFDQFASSNDVRLRMRKLAKENQALFDRADAVFAKQHNDLPAMDGK